MDNTKEIQCPKCHEGKLLCELKTEIFCISGEFGEEWLAEEWLDILNLDCTCSFTVVEQRAIEKMVREIIQKEYAENVTVQEGSEITEDGP